MADYDRDVQEALRDKYLAEAKQARLESQRYQLWIEDDELKKRVRLAGDEHNRVYRFSGAVTGSTVRSARDTLVRWARQDGPGASMQFVMNSPGGLIYDGFELYDEIRALVNDGHSVTTVCRGWAASMAAILMQAGSHRVMGEESRMLLHKPSMMTGGSADDIADASRDLEIIVERMVDIFAKRAEATGREGAFTRAQIKRGINRKDWTLSAEECLTGGFVDEIA